MVIVNRILLSLSACAFCTAASAPSAGAAPERGPGTWWVYIGTYTGGDSEGIYLLELDAASGRLTHRGLAGAAVNPSFLALHPTAPWLYAVGEQGGDIGGTVSAFLIAPETGRLTFLNQASTVGRGPCHVSVDRAGRHVLVANYSGGSTAVLPLVSGGRLGEASSFAQHEGRSVHPERQQGPHAHSVNLDAAGNYAFVADLGLDQVLVYRYDAEAGTVTPNDPPHASTAPGAGPRHFAFHPNGRFAYVINELDNTVTAFAYDAAAGRLDTLQTVPTLPADFEGTNTTAEVRVHPSGRFLYGSNRGHNSIAVFEIEPESGRLTPVDHTSTQGETPRNFNIDPTGRWLLAANQATHTVVPFRIDPETGRLEPAGEAVEVPSPVCVLFVAPIE